MGGTGRLWFAAGIGAGLLGAAALALGPRALPWSRAAAPAADEPLAIEVGGRRLAVPAALVRREDQRGAGRRERLDLALSWPGLGPPPARSAREVLEGAGREADALLFLALTPADGPEPAERAPALYARFLDAEAWSNPGGLVMRRFRAGSPYEGEALYLAPPDGRAFAARCAAPEAAPGVPSAPESCLWAFRVNGLDAQARFPPGALADWPRLAEGARALVAGLDRGPTAP